MLHQRIQSFVVVAVVVDADVVVVAGVGRGRNFSEISHEKTTNMDPFKSGKRRRLMSCAVTSKSTMLLVASLTH